LILTHPPPPPLRPFSSRKNPPLDAVFLADRVFDSLPRSKQHPAASRMLSLTALSLCSTTTPSDPFPLFLPQPLPLLLLLRPLLPSPSPSRASVSNIPRRLALIEAVVVLEDSSRKTERKGGKGKRRFLTAFFDHSCFLKLVSSSSVAREVSSERKRPSLTSSVECQETMSERRRRDGSCFVHSSLIT
jgi:hypothetical protein